MASQMRSALAYNRLKSLSRWQGIGSGQTRQLFFSIKEALSKKDMVTPCISRPCGFGEPLSLRSHGGGVVGLLALADGRLVSRGLEGAIRFWNQKEGQSIQGDNPVAHPYGVGRHALA